jgi:adenylate cyclase
MAWSTSRRLVSSPPRLSAALPSRRVFRRNAVALVLALTSAAVLAVVQATQAGSLYLGTGAVGTLQALDSAVHDLALRSRTPESYLNATSSPDETKRGRDPRAFITIVAIDERTIAELGAYNGGYPRSYHAQLVENLLAGSPRVIAFDIGFFEPTALDPKLVTAFAHASSQPLPTRIVLGAAGLQPRGGEPAAARGDELDYGQGLQALPELAEGADLGLTNVVPDERGAVRSMPLLARVAGVERPTLGLAATAAYLRRPDPVDARPDPATLRIAGRDIPVDRWARVNINYFGPPSQPYGASSTFRVVSFVDVMRGRLDPSLWRNGLVFVGVLGAAGLADDYWTPMSEQGRKMAGVEIHANVAATLFSAEFLREAPVALQLALIFGLAVLVALLAANLGMLGTTLAALFVLGGFVLANVWLLYSRGLQTPLTIPLLAGCVPLVGMLAYRVGTEQQRASALQTALASVIPPSVAREIARDPDRVRLGGERRTITVLFTDLKSFTAFSETVPPELLSRVITDYLDAMTGVVFRHGGTVDKFIGDAVMALWNAPLDDPEHARHACEAALEMQSALARLGDRWEAEGLPRQFMRIGVNTGPASVGNMGTSRRFAYTALGDTVNLGARLEPLNTAYGTSICISQTTLEAAGGYDRFLTRFLDLVEVKGKRQPVAVYELIGRLEDHALVERYRPILDPYRQAIALYQAREFGAAGQLFGIALSAAGDGLPDQPSCLYAARCTAYAQSPPERGWDGVHRPLRGLAA